MTLKDRLSQLQQQRGTALVGPQAPAAGAGPDSSLRAQLERLARTRGRPTPTPSQLDDDALVRRLHGRRLRPGLIAVERYLPLGMAHGRSRLHTTAVEALQLFGASSTRPEGTVFLDCETTGLSTGSGTLVFLLGLVNVMPQGLRLRQYLLTRFQAESALLGEAGQALGEAQTVVTYNGKTFDRPLLASRYRLARLSDPLCALTHIDLLHPTRRAFAERWPDCRLQTVETRLLGFLRTDDLPGAWVPQVWFDWMRNGVAEDLPRLLRHNRWDLLSLVALASALPPCYADPLAHDANVLPILRHRRTEHHTYQYLLANRTRLDRKALLELARLARRQRNWPLAVSIWKPLAADQHLEAIEQLAKYYEHQDLDLAMALRFTRTLTALAPSAAAHRHRQQRLLKKIAAQEQGKGIRTAAAPFDVDGPSP